MISSQEEYDQELKEFNTKLKSYTQRKMLFAPMQSMKEIIDLFNFAEAKGLFPREYCQEQIQKIIQGTNSEELKAKAKAYIKKKFGVK